MIEEYEINRNTIAIIPVDEKMSKIIENNETFLVNQKTLNIIDNSCRYFGSSYKGRHEGTKKLIGINYKSPIIIEETKELIFFPTSSPRYENCHWLCLDKIKEHTESKYGSLVKFVNNEEIEINISSLSLENQILRSIKLNSVLRKRKEY
jgi:competence protein ComK